MRHTVTQLLRAFWPPLLILALTAYWQHLGLMNWFITVVAAIGCGATTAIGIHLFRIMKDIDRIHQQRREMLQTIDELGRRHLDEEDRPHIN